MPCCFRTACLTDSPYGAAGCFLTVRLLFCMTVKVSKTDMSARYLLRQIDLLHSTGIAVFI